MKRVITTILIFFLLLSYFLPYTAIAQDGGPASPPPSESAEERGAGYLPYSEPAPLGSGGFLGAILRAILSLAIVLGLLYVTLWVIRRFAGNVTGPTTEGSVRVVGRIYLSPKTIVYFLRLADQLLVIGTSAGNISLLTSIEDENVIRRIEGDLRSAHIGVSGPSFSGLFDRSLARFQRSLQRDDSAIDDQLRTLNVQIGRLKGLARRRRDNDE